MPIVVSLTFLICPYLEKVVLTSIVVALRGMSHALIDLDLASIGLVISAAVRLIVVPSCSVKLVALSASFCKPKKAMAVCVPSVVPRLREMKDSKCEKEEERSCSLASVLWPGRLSRGIVLLYLRRPYSVCQSVAGPKGSLLGLG